MPPESFIPINLLFSPTMVLKRFEQLRAKYGDPVVLSNSRFKSAREALAAGMFAVALSKHTRKEFWIGSPPADPPDALIVEFSPIYENSTRRLNSYIEVMEWEENSPYNEITDAIQAKLLNKQYSKHTILLVFVHGRNASFFEPFDIHHRLKEKQPNIGEIWILCSAANRLWPSDAAIRVFPGLSKIRYDLSTECRRLSGQREVIKPLRGNMKTQTIVPAKRIELP